MQSYAARLASFTPPSRRAAPWPHPPSYLATPASLAAAGFYFNPAPATPDAVSCFLCDKGLADWDPEDDPARIHADKCPKCPWAVLNCVSDADADGSFSFVSPSRQPGSRPIEKARLATFGPDAKRWWPHEAKSKGPNAKTMAKAGFMYTPASTKDDTCICIYCRTELGGWQPDDDPMEEHRKRQSKNGPCPFFAKQPARSRSKSKPPPSDPTPVSDDEPETAYQPSTSTKKPKPKSKPSKKPKPLAEEVVEEYQVALDADEDAPPKPRPKPRRASSRASSRASTAESDASSSKKTPASSSKKSRSVSSSKKRTPKQQEESDPEPNPPSSSKRTPKDDTDDAPASSKKRTPKDKPASLEPQSQPSTSKKPRSVSSSKKRTPKHKESDSEDPAPVSSGKKTRKGTTVDDDGEEEAPPARRKGKSNADPLADDDHAHKNQEESEQDPPPVRKSKAKAKTAPADAEPALGMDEDPAPLSGPKASTESDTAPMRKTKAKATVDADLVAEDPASPVPRPKLKAKGKTKAAPVDDISEPARGRSQRVAKVDEANVPAPKTNGVEVLATRAPAEDITHAPPNGIHRAHAPAPTLAPAPVPTPTPAPVLPPPLALAFLSFQRPEDEEFALEEQALEAQARVLMGADDMPTPPRSDKGKQRADTNFDAAPTPPPCTPSPPPPRTPSPPPPRTPSPPPRPAAPTPTRFPAPLPESTLTALTDAERAMTVEEWVRHEMERQHARLQHDGRTKTDAFKARAAEVARQIQGL